jgi:hypothetical protein
MQSVAPGLMARLRHAGGSLPQGATALRASIAPLPTTLPAAGLEAPAAQTLLSRLVMLEDQAAVGPAHAAGCVAGAWMQAGSRSAPIRCHMAPWGPVPASLRKC